MKIFRIQNEFANKINFQQHGNNKKRHVSSVNTMPENLITTTDYLGTYQVDLRKKGEYKGNPNVRLFDMGYDAYLDMSDYQKKRWRKLYQNPEYWLNVNELYNPNSPKIPLGTKKDVDELFRVAEMYSQFKDQQIVCLGRSPKWFLKTAQWMDGGIKKYKFSAFSGFWYRQDIFEPGNVVRSRVMEPTEEEVVAYRKYLKRLNLDPATYVRNYKQTGKRTVITDFIETGKGVTSYLEILARYALDQINSGKFNFTMEDFAKSFELFLIGNMENQEKFYLDDSSCMSEPRVVFPEELWPYEKYIKQDFREIKEYSLFEDILMNENTTECRSTYYPHQMWTVYDPDRFKVGMPSKTMKKKEILDYIRKEAVKLKKKDVVASFTPTMRDFRNLLTFKILDELAKAKRLK